MDNKINKKHNDNVAVDVLLILSGHTDLISINESKKSVSTLETSVNNIKTPKIKEKKSNWFKVKLPIISAVIGLVATLVVSSFAWFTMVNNGQLNINVPTTVEDGITFATADYAELEGSLLPAVIKKGVINNHQDYNSGEGYQTGNLDIIDLPYKDELLPLRDNYTDTYGNTLYTTYRMDETGKEFESPSVYLKSPATVVYRQMPMSIGSTSETTKSANFTMHVQYYDLLNQAQELPQSDALCFRFYLFENLATGKDGAGLEDSDLNTITTRMAGNDNSSKQTFDQFFYLNRDRFNLIRFGQEGTIYTVMAEEKFQYNHLDMYRITPVVSIVEGNYFTMNFTLSGLNVNTKYTMLFEAYYSLPDELLDGNLYLTQKINIIIQYSVVDDE